MIARESRRGPRRGITVENKRKLRQTLLLLFCLIFYSVQAKQVPASKRGGVVDSSSVQTFRLHPTAALAEERRQRRLTTHHAKPITPEEWHHPESNAVYATLHGTPDSDAKLDFHRHRHLSRFERHFRESNNLGLQLDWSGTYSTLNTTAATTTATNTTNTFHRKLNSLYGGQFNNYQAVPLSQGYGTHYANLWVGSPIPQRQSVIVDTGSHFTAFPCVGCVKCGAEHHTDPHFDPGKSQSFQYLQCNECVGASSTCITESESDSGDKCQFTQSYTEGSSWQAYQARDVVYCGGQDVLEAANPMDHQKAIPFMFGCLTSETGLFVTQLADGIMGMSAHETTLPKQLYNQRKLEHNMFAMCFRKELGTSKRGVTAGSMTLGGVSSSLDTSPMVYAKNVQSYGWFTVYVKNIYIVKQGGTSFTFDSPENPNIVKVPINVLELNSGKGVIVDSGTTDTYLNVHARKAFTKIWKQVTNMEYTHGPIYLTTSQIRRLPTILIQCQAHGQDYNIPTTNLVGYAGPLDPSSPTDLVIAIPATHYMEYSPVLKLYTSRLYFTETRGGVLGANAMQGHNVLFDWENGRLGFAESTCAYDIIEEDSSQDNHETFWSDCQLGPAILTQPCQETVDVRLCDETDSPTNVALLGRETWTRLVENPGTAAGVSCVQVAADLSLGNLQLDPSQVHCDGSGVCTELRPCEITCAHAKQYQNSTRVQNSVASKTKASSKQLPSTRGGKKFHDDSSKPLSSSPNSQQAECGDTYWSACDYSCKQSRLVSIVHANGHDGESQNVCLETSRTTRGCHVDACGRADPCRVPFIVHAILVFPGGSAEAWTKQSLDVFTQAFVETVHDADFSSMASNRRLFDAGDVDVLVARPWHAGEDGSNDEIDDLDKQEESLEEDNLGLKLVVQVSMFNPKAHPVAPTYSDDGPHRRIEERVHPSSTVHRNVLQEIEAMMRNITSPFQRKKSAHTTCEEADLYPLAKDAVEVANGILEHQQFVPKLIQRMEDIERDIKVDQSPFLPIYKNIRNAQDSRVLSSWTINTQVYDDNINYLGPIAMTPFAFLSRIFYEASLIFLALSLLSFIFQSISKWTAGLQQKLMDCFRRAWAFVRRRQRYEPVDGTDNDAADDDSLTDKIMGSPRLQSVHRNQGNPKKVHEIELTYSHSFSEEIHHPTRSCTQRRNSLSERIMGSPRLHPPYVNRNKVELEKLSEIEMPFSTKRSTKR